MSRVTNQSPANAIWFQFSKLLRLDHLLVSPNQSRRIHERAEGRLTAKLASKRKETWLPGEGRGVGHASSPFLVGEIH